MGLTWAFGWSPVGALVGGLLYALVPGPPIGVGTVVLLNAAVFGVLGFVGGATFAGLLSLAEGRRDFDELVLPRFAGLGAVGGVLLGTLAVVSGLWGGSFDLVGAGMIAASTLLGGASAAGSLAIARRADRELLESGSSAGRGELPAGSTQP